MLPSLAMKQAKADKYNAKLKNKKVYTPEQIDARDREHARFIAKLTESQYLEHKF